MLGHIFEQSVTDIERMRAEARGEAPPKVTKRKREGVVYTPDLVTRFLVEQTIGRTLAERHARLSAEHGLSNGDIPPEKELAYWQAWLDVLRRLTIVDPACGSGAFLIAAFDRLVQEYQPVLARLDELGAPAGLDAFDEIVAKNLYGVDLNPESVEITRLSLWLKTARRGHRLQSLDATIRAGDSLIADGAFTSRPFDWRAAFPHVFERGGFDIVIGNPPYVRMEHLKPVKPWLAENYVVAADRTDLYAYFYERGVKLLGDGGRLGFISSSTFFRTGSGENLRIFLTDGVRGRKRDRLRRPASVRGRHDLSRDRDAQEGRRRQGRRSRLPQARRASRRSQSRLLGAQDRHAARAFGRGLVAIRGRAAGEAPRQDRRRAQDSWRGLRTAALWHQDRPQRSVHHRHADARPAHAGGPEIGGPC